MNENENALLARGHESVTGLGAVLWRKRFFILLPTLLAFAASLAFVTFTKPRYTGEARVLLENRETPYSRAASDNRSQDPAIDPEAVASQVQNVMSRDLALKVVREMNLANLPEFGELGMLGKLQNLVGMGPDAKLSAEERAVAVYLTRLLAYAQTKSRVISIEFQSQDPQLAADIANRIAAEYLLREESAKTTTSRNSSEWLDRAIAPLHKKVEEAEGKVEAFRTAKGLFLGAGGGTITSQQLAELNTQLTNARTAQADLAARARLIREAVRLGRIFETSEVNNNELVRRLLEQRAAMKAQMALEERTLLPGHPRIRELAAQLGDLEGQIRAAADRAARALENDARVAGARVASMQAEIDTQKKSAALSNEDEVQLKGLERDAASLREQLNSYRMKFLDAAARAGENAHLADARIISKAYAAIEPTFPKKVPVVLLATLGTLALASTLVATNALMARAAAADPAVPAGYADPYGYGAVPMPTPAAVAALEPAGVEAHAPTAPPAFAPTPVEMQEASSGDFAPAEELARELAMMNMLGRGKVVMVYALEHDPKLDLAALRFARRLARDGAAITLDLVGQESEAGQGNLFARLLPPDSAGLNQYLDAQAALGDIIHRDSRSSLHVIPAGGAAHHRLMAPGLRDSVSSLIEALRCTYTHVVIASGTVGGSGEIFARHADAIVLLSRRPVGDAYLDRAVEKLESLRDAPVYVVSEGEAQPPVAANDAFALGAFSHA